MTNAINYTPPGGKVTLLTRSQRSEDRLWATLSVRDSGPGIPAEELPRLFERFFRGSLGRASGNPGTGLGLSIAREIVVRHNGRLDLSRNSPEGAEFTIWIPALEPAAGGL
jgi:signal transduction histidine kinase